jgi:hypothetical protein
MPLLPAGLEVVARAVSMAGITPRMFLTHSAGFRSATWPWGGDQP